MNAILLGGLTLSLLHALIPSHWLPIVVLGRHNGWSARQMLWVTLLAGLSHVTSTLLIGLLLSSMGWWLALALSEYIQWVASALLVALGAFYFYRHHHHHHFHLQAQHTRWGVVGTLMAAMFFSPCLEIEAYFLAAGRYGWPFVGLLALLYASLTIAGMLIWVGLVLYGLRRLDWHTWEHNAGIITALTLVLSGLALLFLR